MEITTQRPDFWNIPETAAQFSEELAQLKQNISDIENLQLEVALLAESPDEVALTNLSQKIAQKEIFIFLSQKYDSENAILTIYSGAGGQDAQDWVAMLLRMYQRYCLSMNFKTTILHESFGQGITENRIGYKEVSIYIKGKFAYGFLKKEAGVHRLVRLSPFNAKHLRQTSFALVEIYPELPKCIKKNRITLRRLKN